MSSAAPDVPDAELIEVAARNAPIGVVEVPLG